MNLQSCLPWLNAKLRRCDCLFAHILALRHFVGANVVFPTQQSGGIGCTSPHPVCTALHCTAFTGHLRYEDGVLVIPKALVKSPISAYENTLEVESVAALEEIISDPDSMRMQVGLILSVIVLPLIVLARTG